MNGEFTVKVIQNEQSDFDLISKTIKLEYFWYWVLKHIIGFLKKQLS